MELYLVLVTLSALVVAPTLYFCTKDIPNADDEYKKRIDEEYFNMCVKPELDAKVDSLVDRYWNDIARDIYRAYNKRPMSYNVYSNQPKEWYFKIPASYNLSNSLIMLNDYQKQKFIEDVFKAIKEKYWSNGNLKSLTYGNRKGLIYFVAVIERYNNRFDILNNILEIIKEEMKIMKTKATVV